MTEDLKNRIRNFLVGWDHTSMDEGFGLEDYDLWINDAINLLTEVLGNSKLKEYVVTYHWPRNEEELYSFVCMADDVEHAMEQCENAYIDCEILSAEESNQ
jgi:hypothetical protein